MSAYQPFLISGFKTGLSTDVATWLLPPDAFPTLENAYLKDGVINKRSGSQFFAQFVDNVGDTTNQITGIYEYVGLSSGAKETELLFTDTKRMCRYNAVTELCEAIDVADIFSSSNYKWFANFGITGSVTQNRLFITDNNPTGAPPATAMRTYSFNSATTSDFLPQYGALASDVAVTCLLMFPIKNRLVLLNTVEDSGTLLRKPQRARWCVAGDPSTTANQWRQDIPGNGGFVDCPTADFIIGAAPLQDYLIVFFSNSTWSLKPTSDPALPFRWDRINNYRACDATFSIIQHDKYAISFGKTGIIACDGIETNRIDNNIQEFVTKTVTQSNFSKLYSARNYSERRSWTLFNSSENANSENDSALIRSEEEGSWSVFNIKMSCLGNGASEKDFRLSDFTGDYDYDFNDFSENEDFISYYAQNDSRLFFGGDYEGRIYLLDAGNSDDTALGDDNDISMELLTAGFNPYQPQGIEAQLGYVDIYVDQSVGGELEIGFIQDDNVTPSSTETINLIPQFGWLADVLSISKASTCRVTAISHGISTGTEVHIYGVKGMVEINTGPFTVTYIDENNFDLQGVNSTAYTTYTSGGTISEIPTSYKNTQVWKRVYSGAIGYLHQLKITNTGKDHNIRIHAIKPWFRAVGSRQLS